LNESVLADETISYSLIFAGVGNLRRPTKLFPR